MNNFPLCVCRAQLEEKSLQQQRLREVELKAQEEKSLQQQRLRQMQLKSQRKIRAADKQINLFKKREERVQELKRQVNTEVALRQAEEKMRQAAEEELIHVRALMTQEVQRAAQETLAKEAFQAELNAAIRQLQHFQNQHGFVQQHRRHANSEMELRKIVEEELSQVRTEMKEEVQSLHQEMESLEEENERLQGLVQAQTSLRVQTCDKLEEVTRERDSMGGKVDELRDAAMSAKREVERLRVHM